MATSAHSRPSWIHPWRSLGERLAALAAAGCALWVYAAFSHPAPDWLDSPELFTAALGLKAFHPPGAPLAVLVGQLFGLWPFAAPSRSLLLFSAVFAAGAVYLSVRLIQALWQAVGPANRALASTVAACLGLALGLGPGLGSQAVRTEVYCLGLFLCAAALRELIRAGQAAEDQPGQADRRLDRACALMGMAFAVHPLQALGPVAAALVQATSRRGRPFWLRPTRAVRRLAFGLLGAGPVFLLPLLVRDFADLRWADPTTLSGWLAFASGWQFSPSFAPQAQDVAATGPRLLVLWLLGLGFPLALLAAAGAYLLLRKRAGLGGALLAWIAAGGLTLGLQPRLRLDNPDATGYALPALIALTLLAAGGLAVAATLLEARRRGLGWLVAAAAAGCLCWTVLSHAPEMDRSGCTAGRQLAEQALRSVPADGLVLVSDFNLLFMFDYLTRVERVRTDLLVLYVKDLDNPALRARLAESEPALEHSLPTSSRLDADSLGRLAVRRPLALDAGPLWHQSTVEILRPGGLLWTVQAEPPRAPPAPAGSSPAGWTERAAACAPDGRSDPRTAAVICWQAYWQARAAIAQQRLDLAARLLQAAACACPEDRDVATTAAKLGLEARRHCPRIGPAQPFDHASNRVPIARGLLLAAGLALWSTALCAGRRASRRLWPRLVLALVGLAILALALV